VLVVSIEQALAAPLATCRLADAGARVIKIERPEGDFARGYDRAAAGEASYFVWTNRGKESLVLDYKQASDAALLHRLLERADVFVQNLAPEALERAGFGSASLRQRYPRLITCDISGYGQGHAASQLKAYDLLVQCESGLVSVSGSPGSPGRIGVSICDIGAGMNAHSAILNALLLRGRTGQGSALSVSLFDGAADWMSVPYVHERYGQGAPAPAGLAHPSIAPYGAFISRDGVQVVISIQNDREWARLCEQVLQAPTAAQDERMASNTLRVQHRSLVDDLVRQGMARLDWPNLQAALDQAQIAYGQVRDVGQLLAHPALRTWPMPVRGQTLDMVAPASRSPWDSGHYRAAPSLGEHSHTLRQEFAAPPASTTFEPAP
jgi:crotonobetainyl-CoA:carnitine CoA-transferase CaiB-like acyl-CoA transferase